MDLDLAARRHGHVDLAALRLRALLEVPTLEVFAGFDVEAPTLLGGSANLTDLFQRLLPLPDEAVLAVLAVIMGESLASGSAVVEAVGVHLGVDMASLWQADDALFELVRDKEVLAEMVAEVAGPEVAAANSGEKGKTLKTIIRDCLAGENGRPKVEGWVPRWLRFPASSYTARGQAEALPWVANDAE